LQTRYGLRGKRVATAAAATLAVDVLDLQASSDRPRRGRVRNRGPGGSER
jgi:hypothetical protein